jgi:L-fuculose-phosphate aldolase
MWSSSGGVLGGAMIAPGVPAVSCRTAYDAPMDRHAAGEAIVLAGARLGRRGLISAGEGNLSCRLADGGVLITPSGRHKDELSPADLVLVDPGGVVEGAVAGLRPSSDLAIHLAIYRARPDVMAIAHAHLPASMGLTLAGEIPDATALPETEAALGRVPFVPFGAMGSPELAGRVAAALGEPPEPLPVSVLLERHGAVAIGNEPAIAADRLELLEVLCRAWRDALFVRAARATLRDDAPG